MDGLARLQIDALRSSEQGLALAESRGFNVLGRGSTRLGIEGEDGTVVKVAHDLDGLWLNLHEAAVWLAATETVRRHLTPCLTLSPELILTQRRVEVIGPTLTHELCALPAWESANWVGRHQEARRAFGERIYACRDALGLGSDPDPAKLRLDNFGLRDGRVVLIDYGDQFPPLESEWARLLNVDSAEPVTFRLLVERAGLTAENTDACPCLCGGTFSDGDPEVCQMDTEVAELLAERTLGTPLERATA